MTMFRKFRDILTISQRRTALGLLGLMVIGMLLETVGVGLILPAIALMTRSDLAAAPPELAPIFDFLGNPSQTRLVVIGMLALVTLYFVKTLFLMFLALKQNEFAFNVQANLSHRLFMGYLRQPWTFHLQRNSAELLRNVISETSTFAHSGLIPGTTLLIE